MYNYSSCLSGYLFPVSLYCCFGNCSNSVGGRAGGAGLVVVFVVMVVVLVVVFIVIVVVVIVGARGRKLKKELK